MNGGEITSPIPDLVEISCNSIQYTHASIFGNWINGYILKPRTVEMQFAPTIDYLYEMLHILSIDSQVAWKITNKTQAKFE